MDELLAALDGDVEGVRSLVAFARRHNTEGSLRWVLELLWREMIPEVVVADPSAQTAMDGLYGWWTYPGQNYHALTVEADRFRFRYEDSSWECFCGSSIKVSHWTGPTKISVVSDSWVCRVCVRRAAREFVDPRPMTFHQIQNYRNQCKGHDQWEFQEGFRGAVDLRPTFGAILFPHRETGNEE